MRLVVVGGSDAGISAALRARELDPGSEVTVVVADGYPNFSICGIPYLISGEVTHWRNLAHRSHADLTAAGMDLLLNTRAVRIDPAGHRLTVDGGDGDACDLRYDALVVGTGAEPVVPPIEGLRGPGALGPADGVHRLHTMGDTFDLIGTLEKRQPARALIVGAGYVGLEMADGLGARGLEIVQVERLPEVLPTVDPELGAIVHTELVANGVQVHTSTSVHRISRSAGDRALQVDAVGPDGEPVTWSVDLVLVSAGVRPSTELLIDAGAEAGIAGAVSVDEQMRTGLPDVFAAGDCVVTHHRLLGATYLPLGTTAHKQGRVAGENAIGGNARFAGSLGTQVVKVFDVVAARTGVRDHEATAWAPATTQTSPDDHKAYYPGAHPITTRITGDLDTGRLLGAQLVGRLGTEISKRIDIFATAIHHHMDVADLDQLDLSYTPPLGSPFDAVQMAAQAWVGDHKLQAQREALVTYR